MQLVHNSEYMSHVQMLEHYEGKFVAIWQPDEKLRFEGGKVVAFCEDNIMAFSELSNYLNDQYGPRKGHVKFIRNEEEEDLYVVFRDVR